MRFSSPAHHGRMKNGIPNKVAVAGTIFRQRILCDVTSFAVVEERAIDFVFGFDHHFRMAGFDLRPGV